ncbi:putative redox protein [Escovopsis weberi]|uniref:Putative redox protein n=1 Tax=Escovopsis weberi TaxID=150374 RepID=A0A0M8MWP0_ESCWE|nr:putative redox protein [Escovopsis weberi]
MFSFSRKTLDIVTLFHKATSPASVRVANLLKQVSTGAQADAISDKGAIQREPFELNVTEDAPTPEQVETILQYVGKNGVSSIIKGARDEKDAMRKFKESKENLLKPITVDWNQGRAYGGDNESEILKLLNAHK